MNFSPYTTIAEFLFSVETGLVNGRSSPTIAAALAQHGYDAAKMDAGAALLHTAQTLTAHQPTAYGEQVAATEQLNEAWQTADKSYAAHRKIARIALRDDAQAQMALLLNQRRPHTRSDWLTQAELFYANALDDAAILAALAQFNMTDETLMAGQTAVSHITQLLAIQQQRIAAARKATKQRNDALRALRHWHRDFRIIAQIALDGSQMLESLGLKITVE